MEMDHFYINQICTNCWRGNQIFRVDLSLYNANGILREGTDELDQFIFMCILLENDKIRLLHFFSSKHNITFEAYRKTTQTTGRCIKETEYCISK